MFLQAQEFLAELFFMPQEPPGVEFEQLPAQQAFTIRVHLSAHIEIAHSLIIQLRELVYWVAGK